MEFKYRQGRYFPKEVKERTFAYLIDRYIENELPQTPKVYLNRLASSFGGKITLDPTFLCRISPSMLAELRDQLLKETTYRKSIRSPSTVNRYLAALSKALTTAVKEWGWLKENPLQKITRPREAKGRERYLEKEEISKLLTECKKSQKSPYLYPIVLFALATGARFGEIVNLKWDELDFSRSIAIFRDTKNGETRSVPLSPIIIGCLKEEYGRRLVPSQYIFPSKDGKKPADIRTGIVHLG